MTTTADTASTPPDEELPARARGWGVPVVLAVVAIVALIALGAAAATLLGGSSAETVTFVVPEGTTEKVFFGETVQIMPDEVRLDVGDTLVIRNDDIETVAVGPFTVRAGETLTQKFRRPQTLVGECTLSGSGEVKIIVA